MIYLIRIEHYQYGIRHLEFEDEETMDKNIKDYKKWGWKITIEGFKYD